MRSKGCLSNKTALAMIFKVGEATAVLAYLPSGDQVQKRFSRKMIVACRRAGDALRMHFVANYSPNT